MILGMGITLANHKVWEFCRLTSENTNRGVQSSRLRVNRTPDNRRITRPDRYGAGGPKLPSRCPDRLTVVYGRQKFDFEAILGGKLCLEEPIQMSIQICPN